MFPPSPERLAPLYSTMGVVFLISLVHHSRRGVVVWCRLVSVYTLVAITRSFYVHPRFFDPVLHGLSMESHDPCFPGRSPSLICDPGIPPPLSGGSFSPIHRIPKFLGMYSFSPNPKSRSPFIACILFLILDKISSYVSECLFTGFD